MSLKKARYGYKDVEGMLDVEESCWALVITLEKLKIIPKDWSPITYVASHSPPMRDLVDNWYALYLDMMEAGDLKL